MHRTLAARIIGFVSSLIFTCTAFLLVILHMSIEISTLLILTLAIFQFATQSICFLNVLSEKGVRWNLVIFISTISMVLIIIIGSILIMNHLNYNMMMR